MTSVIDLAYVPALLAAFAAVVLPAVGPRLATHLNRLFAVAVGGAGTAISVAGLAGAGHLDPAGAAFLLVDAVIGAASALLTNAYLRDLEPGYFLSGRRWYQFGLYAFWSALLALPVVGNLGVAWLLVEATTGASALLVAHSGKRRALEAGWKYLLLTTMGLTVALLGIVFLYAAAAAQQGGSLAILDWGSLHAAAGRLPAETVVVSSILIMAGLAAKIGWAPVHHWLPDAHSEAPAPVSAMLSGALLPSVVLVAWRFQEAMSASPGGGLARTLFTVFGLASIALAVPFLWRPMAIKRLLAYSSLEHMGILALGLGFGRPIALVGVVIHLWGHALAKSLGFYAALPIFRVQPSATRRPPAGIARLSPDAGAAMAVSLFTLSGLPPSPLFFSELFILIGGVLAGQQLVVAATTVLLALGFIGIAHQLIEGLLGRPRRLPVGTRPDLRIRTATVIIGTVLLVLSGTAVSPPGSRLLTAVARWGS